MPLRVSVLLAVSVLPSAIVKVDPVAGAVIATLLMLVALATPSVGVVKLGDVANTNDPEPVSSVTAARRFVLFGVARNVATLAPKPETPVLIGNPVQLVNVPEVGVPNTGVVKLGLVAKTNAPEPVSSVTAAARFALEGVARNVAMPDPKPLIPVLTGKPVQLVSVPDAGVPKAGVTNVGLVARTMLPVPVLAVHSGAVPPAFT